MNDRLCKKAWDMTDLAMVFGVFGTRMLER